MNASSSIAEALGWARTCIDAVDARVLLCHVLDCSSAHLAAWPERTLATETLQAYFALVKRREKGEPVAYLTGTREFYGRLFSVSPAVLIPRPETELLVELALAHFQEKRNVRVLDMGTGSGVLAVTLALELDQADITAVDFSRRALHQAMANAVRLGASISFVQSNWFDALGGDLFQLIVANPPYIAATDDCLKQGDLRFEPRGALASGPAGLNDLVLIIRRAPHYMEAGGWLFLEHGYDQALVVRGLLLDAGFSGITTWKDLAGIERVSGGKWEGKK